MNTKYKYTVLYLLSCLGLHSKMCATQMNTSDNPELWDIQLSSWLFCELMRQLCPCLMASSCYFFGFEYYVLAENLAWHTMHARSFSQLAGRFPVTKPLTSDQRLSRILMRQARTYHTARTITLASDYSLTGTQRFTIPTFLQTSRAAVSNTRKHGAGHTYSVTSCTQR